MAKTIADLEAAEYGDRLERIRELAEDAKGPWTNVSLEQQVIDYVHELERIAEAAAEIVYMPADQVFTDSSWIFDGVLFLGEDAETAVLRGHVDRDDAVNQVDIAYASYTGDDLRGQIDEPLVDALGVKYTHAVFMAALPEEEYDWWCRTLDDPVDGRTEPITWVDLPW